MVTERLEGRFCDPAQSWVRNKVAPALQRWLCGSYDDVKARNQFRFAGLVGLCLLADPSCPDSKYMLQTLLDKRRLLAGCDLNDEPTIKRPAARSAFDEEAMESTSQYYTALSQACEWAEQIGVDWDLFSADEMKRHDRR
jgi:hypothetical protein